GIFVGGCCARAKWKIVRNKIPRPNAKVLLRMVFSPCDSKTAPPWRRGCRVKVFIKKYSDLCVLYVSALIFDLRFSSPSPFQGEGRGEGHSEPSQFVPALPPCFPAHHGSKSAVHDNLVFPKTDSVYHLPRHTPRVGRHPAPLLAFPAHSKSQQRMDR